MPAARSTPTRWDAGVVDIPDKRVARFKVPVIENGARVWRDMEEFNTAGDGVHAHWADKFFARIVDSVLAVSENRGSLVGEAKCYLLHARGLLDVALPVMKAVAADPHAALIRRSHDDPTPSNA